MKLLMCNGLHRRICRSAPAMRRPRHQHGDNKEGNGAKNRKSKMLERLLTNYPILTVIPAKALRNPQKNDVKRHYSNPLNYLTLCRVKNSAEENEATG